MASSLHIAAHNQPVLPNEWSWHWLDDVMDIRGGAQPEASTFVDEPLPGYVRFVQIRDFDTDGHVTYIKDSTKWRKCSPSDILIARYGASLGRILRGIEGAYNVALVKAVPTNIEAAFLYHLLRSNFFQGPIIQSGARSAQAGFNKRDLGVIPVPVPPKNEQRAIASVLDALDDKIELNRKMSATLEAVARALFKSWFVDFDPVRAKAEGRDPGLPAEIAALFPSSIQSVHGITFPSGWCLSPLSSLSASIRRGISPAYTDVGVLVINQKCIRNGHIDLSRARRHDSAIKSVDSRMVLRGDVLVNSTGVGTLGRVAPVVALPEGEVTVDSHVSIVRPDPTAVEPMYLGSAMLNLQSEIEMMGEGTTGQTELSRARLKALTLVTPPKPIQERYARFVEPLLLKVAKSAQQSETLAALRDALLPKLISGEFRVGDAERVMAAST